MVRSHFPGKPSKHFNRRKVSAVNTDENEGTKEAEDVYRRLSVFNMLFSTEDEDNSFHGFSPHEIDGKTNSSPQKVIRGKRKLKKINVSNSPRKSNNGIPSIDKPILEKPETSIENPEVHDLGSEKLVSCDSVRKSDVKKFEVCDKIENKDDFPSNPTLSGKFVLPSRSAHSSRVIKPNKRFLQTDVSMVPCKRSRLSSKHDLDGDKNVDALSNPNIQLDNNGLSTLTMCGKTLKKLTSYSSTNSPVKFILRKPRLKIKSQPLSTMGGPFTSPGANSLSLQNQRLTKVCCGVCGCFRTYRFFKQARKFGIFSCEPCRRFILKIIRLEREKLLKTLVCSSGTGNCPIRQSTLITQPFSNDTADVSSRDEPSRCEACWLNLCLRSFHMPQRLSKRLYSYLPTQITQKSLLSFDKCPVSDWRDGKKTLDVALVDEKLPTTSNEQGRLPRKNKVLRENINIRRGSNTSLRLSSHRGRGHNGRDEDTSRRVKARQKLPLTGPRVKHVCRSASLVLGQPTATFLPAGQQQSSTGSQNGPDVLGTGENQEIRSVENDANDNLFGEKMRKISDEEYALSNNTRADYPPVARMLQDLGRANCELLDGMENHELEKQNARVSIDFWESYDPEEVSQMGFPLIGYNPLKLRALCFLCGSAGHEKMVHCSSCCEPYHMFCVSNILTPSVKPSGDWWRIDWLCPKCTPCEACMKTGGVQLSCSHCHKSYHSVCISTVRANMSDSAWVCPSCLFCKSCNDTSVHVFVGNMPLCKACFKLRKKGNFCPLCQCCYDDNDYNTKMMECAECKCWIHAKCEGISNEKYQILSYLPSTVEFICKLCCKKPPAPWLLAVDAELKAGYLNVIKILSKNRNACAMLKASPKKQRVCTCLNKNTNPIHLQDLMSGSESLQIESSISPERDIKTPDLGLLTPKLTKDDEESLKTVKSDFLNLVTEEKEVQRNCSSDKEMTKKSFLQDTVNNDRTRLLSIAYDRLVQSNDLTMREKLLVKENILAKDKTIIADEKVCTCKILDCPVQTLNLLTIKNKAAADEYRSVLEFHQDMESVINEIGKQDLTDTYNRCLKQIFPWFDSSDSGMNDSVISGVGTPKKSSFTESNKHNNKLNTNQEEYPALKGLLNFEPNYYYIGSNVEDTRHCLFCKGVGEGMPMKEGRLLYCGQNDWVHTNCAMWSSEVFEEIDGSLQNVHSAISRARLIRCYECGKKGASLGCCAKSCPTAYHFTCAHLANCIFLDNKELYCKVHTNLKGNKEIHREEDFHIKRSVYVELDHKKRKDVLRNEVRLYIGSLEVIQIGEILPELSDDSEIIIPCDYKCSRYYWSSKEPWKIVKYSIQTKITNLVQEYTYENDTNYTVDHSLEITPPPSPIDSLRNDTFVNNNFLEKEIKAVISHLLDTVCSKEEDGNLSDQQNTDLLPPEVKDAIFEDLPQDFLDRISVHDIFTKMSFDDILLSDTKVETGEGINLDPASNKLKNSADKAIEKVNTAQSNLYKMVRVVKQRKLEKIKECESFLDRENRNKWKRQSILQVDGAMDLSESDQSNDSCDLNVKEENGVDKPVKCARCHRTYRTRISYDRHLSTCNVDYPSCSESDLSEEEKTQSIPDESSNKLLDDPISSATQTCDSEIQMFNIPVQVKTITNEQKVQTAMLQNSFENTMLCVDGTNYNGLRENSEAIVNLNYSTLNGNGIHNATFTTNEQTLVSASIESVGESVVGLQTPTIIVQQVPSNDNILPTYLPPTYQEPSQQPGGIHYITAINTQEKTQFLTANSVGQGTYHIQSPIAQPTTVVQNVPTVLGTIIQANGVEQYILNNTQPNVDVYSHQNNMYIANHAPMIVGMETVVSNTVMSSSRFISGSAPGPVLASSYSATTTQVFQAAKPIMDIPQSYLVVNTNPPQLVADNGNQCIQSVIQNGSLTANPSWNSYKIEYQDAVKLNKNITYQSMSHQIVNQKQDMNGLKMISANDQALVLTPIAMKPPRSSLPSQRCENPVSTATIMPISQPVISMNSNNLKPTSLVKVVELPSSSAVYKEKPQQAVAPVVIKKMPPESAQRLTDLKVVTTNNYKGNDTAYKDTSRSTQSNAKMLRKSEPVMENTSAALKKQNKLAEPPPLKDSNKVKIHPTTSKITEKKSVSKSNGCDLNRKRKIVHEEPKISFEITSEDGFSYCTTNINEAWKKVFETVQHARKARNLPPLTQNPFSSPDSMLKKLMGLGSNSMKYLLEQLPGISSCSKYKPVYHRKTLSALEKELSRGGGLNPSGCARTEKYHHSQKTYDMFSWLASRHRRPPKLLASESDGVNGNSRRATSMNLPMAMRFRHLKETSKVSVGVFRSDIHGRGLFCLRDIDAGEMVIEYAGEVIRSALTDKRERYYTEKGIGCYMFRIDDKSVVDATMKGNAARFINHSCEPNCYSRVIDILGKKHILIFALRRILQGEELTYDYKFPLEEEKINCHCLSRKCRKYLN
ncbi:unnamed protein product [Nezara viridula]|uniref:Histone-lysine N-methyltransferase trithorax n=1 Tax=Nezara viridula TaxID=85310 RepID=A0A9P0HFG7_NEZVI|nr:unnamed protein product [Nezara viridula]